jgi:hypothetical protein
MENNQQNKIYNYIYLLQVREFIKTSESVYKIGKTKQNGLSRFNNYPKGSVLLLHIICSNCDSLEKDIIAKFKEKYKQRKDIGNEYFEGNYREMIQDIIALVTLEKKIDDILKELGSCVGLNETMPNEQNKNKDKENEDKRSEQSEEDEQSEEKSCETITIEDYKSYDEINDKFYFQITNKSKMTGYLRFKDNYTWYRIDEKDDPGQYTEKLEGWITHNSTDIAYMNKNGDLMNTKTKNKNNVDIKDWNIVNINYDWDKIMKDICKKFYTSKVIPYKLKYDEFVINVYQSVTNSKPNPQILKCSNFSFNNIDDIVHDKELEKYMKKDEIIRYNFIPNDYIVPVHGLIIKKGEVNTKIVDDVLHAYVKDSRDLKHFRELCSRIFINEGYYKFNEYYEKYSILSTLLNNVCLTLGHNIKVSSTDYYADKKEYDKLFCKTKPRIGFV